MAGAAVAIALGVATGVALAVDFRLGIALALAILLVPVALLDPPVILALWAGLAVVSRYPGVGLALTATGLLAVATWLVHARADPSGVREALRPHRRLLILIALVLGWLTLSLGWARDPSRAATDLVSWYVNAAAVVALLCLLRTPRDVNLVIAAMIGAVAASVTMGLAGVDSATSEGRLQGASGDPNFMAAFIVPAVVLAAVLHGAAASRWRVILPGAIALLIVGLAATESRGGLLAITVATITALAVMRGRRVTVLAVAAGVALVGAAWVSANPDILERIQSAEQDRGNGREDLWLVAQRMSADHPVQGVGLGNFTLRSPEYVRRPGALSYVELVTERPHETHNTYLQMLAETGVVGLALFLALLAVALASAVRAARAFEHAGRRELANLSRGVLVATIGLLTAAVFITAQSTAMVWVVIALGPALLGVATRSRHAGLTSPVGG